MNADSLCIDVEDVKRKVTPKTAGVIVVHIAGFVCPQINELKQLCDEKGLFLLEDCAHAHGATLDGKRLELLEMQVASLSIQLKS